MKMPQIFPLCGAMESRIALGSVTHPNFLLDGGFYTVESFATNGFPETREHTHTQQQLSLHGRNGLVY